MRSSVHAFRLHQGWDSEPDPSLDGPNTLVLVFATSQAGDWLDRELERLAGRLPQSLVMGCSSAGQFVDDRLVDDGMAVAVLAFDHTRLRLVAQAADRAAGSRTTGRRVATQLSGEQLRAVFTLTDGLRLNGSAYVRALTRALPGDVVVSGGMAADADRFVSTWVARRGRRTSGEVLACGFYGERLHIAHASQGGWVPLGIDRLVTHSEGNVLYTLDERPALALYKEYLGERASELPAAALLFPLALSDPDEADGVTVRTILGIDEARQSIRLAGDVPQGARVRLMRSTFDRLIDAAALAGESVAAGGRDSGVCIAVSCVGRRLLLGSRSDEELEAVRQALPSGVAQLGFYAYGEISPLPGGRSELHNQTMTLTLLAED